MYKTEICKVANVQTKLNYYINQGYKFVNLWIYNKDDVLMIFVK